MKDVGKGSGIGVAENGDFMVVVWKNDKQNFGGLGRKGRGGRNIERLMGFEMERLERKGEMVCRLVLSGMGSF